MDAPLLCDVVKGSVDYSGRPAIRSETGRWRSAIFIIGVEIAERFSYNGISSNLITYLTGPLQQSMVTAAVNVNTWTGISYMLPLFGAFVADAYLGRYRTILLATLLYVLGLGFLTLSAVLPFSPPSCHNSINIISCHPPQFQIIFFFCSLYLVALAQGGHKPCAQAFGADQFEVTDPQECKSKSSFFNWWYFGICAGAFCTHSVLTYIQDNLNWGLGFGIPCACMVVALTIFLLGTKTYRHSFNDDKDNQFQRIALVFVAAVRNWRATPSTATDEEEGESTLLLNGTNQFSSLVKAPATISEDSKEGWLVSSVSQEEDAKAILKLFPIWATCILYTIVDAQYYTFFTKQGATMDRTIGSSGFKIPPASLQTFISISIILFMPIYDRILIPIARVFTNIHSGITTLQRIGTGIVLSMISMVLAALVERQRLQIAIDYKIVDIPEATVPMSFWWLVPQYIFLGIAEALAMVGLQEFFYDQMPNGLKSMGLAFYLSIFGVGSFLSSFLISGIEKVTGGDGHDSWFSNNINRAHLDYFYWLLTGLSVVELAVYLYFAKSYTYRRADV
ncbi:protein NRT1/ PTR FAMILY 5.10-like isoform X1 [Macadamia integrifolia]|uniref:protein NRT1/ PTR FAMILY 5.10-like isoform X1 n=1 Tax=Macadamia integrifolia TaxID=60698 RepID=UPI001C4F08F4|nr:protein NRT1/ PTR FAMILY 5.10-like isoform X1 [Macadamia integrifolia]